MKEIDDNCHVIIIGGDHYNTLWLVRCLGFKGLKPDVIVLSERKKSFVCKSKYINFALVVHCEEELILELEKRKTLRKQILISSSDVITKILDSRYDTLKESYVLPNCGGETGKITYWMDKSKMLNVAREVGINTPYSKAVHLDNDFCDVDLNAIQYPCLIKPQMSVNGHKEDFRICNNKEELDKALDTIRLNCKDVLIQQYIVRDFEFVVNGIRCGNKHLIPGVIRKVKVGQNTNNMGMTTIAYSDAKINKYIEVNKIKDMMDIIDYNGIYSVEFIVSDGIPYLLEINFRSDATVYISTTGGVNLPYLWVALALGKEVEPICYFNKKTGMAEVSYVKELPLKRPWKIIVDWWKTDCYSIFSWKDIMPFFYKFIYAV